ncbi:MAG: apolipoprotein N-acyltransferase [Spirochaetales bacterium]|nr:apolipoprotein N-acyltransferase [Spirochaetales bacterium]
MLQVEKKRLYGIVGVVIFAVELTLCFNGPFSFVHRPTIMLFPPFQENIAPGDEERLMAYLEQQFALGGSFTLVDNRSLEEHIIRTDPDRIMEHADPKNVDEAHAMAKEMDLERFGTITIWPRRGSFEISVYIRDVREKRSLKSGHFKSSSFEDFLAGLDIEGEPLNISEVMKNKTKGIGFADYIVLALLGLQLITALIALTGKDPGFLIEVLLAPSIIIFLFALIHALSANLDYVQRYIASGGQLRLAKNTALAQLYAVLRYGPLILLNGYLYGIHSLKTFRLPGLSRPDNLLEKWIKPWAFGWTLLSALLFALSFPNFISLNGFGFLGWIALVPLMLVLIASPPVRAVAYGVIFGVIQALILNYWLGTYKYVTLHMTAIAHFGEYLLFMIPLVLTVKLSRRWGFLTVPLAWTVFDYLRSIGILGFPWGLVGSSQYRFIPLIQIASLSGVWGIGYVVLMVNAALAWTAASWSMNWNWKGLISGNRSSGSRYSISCGWIVRSLPLTIAAAVFLISLGTGSLLLLDLRHRMNNAPDSALIIALQQNTDPRKREHRENTDKLMELTALALEEAGEKADLILWPEGGFRLDLRNWGDPEKGETRWGKMAGDFMSYQKGLETWLVTGTQDHDEITLKDGSVKRMNFNSSVFLNEKGEIVDFYHKMHLVPFSEYFPLDKEKFSWLSDMFSKYNISNWSVGDERKVIAHPKMNIFTPICFEDVFSDHIRRFVLNDADVILNMSNDYWSLSPVEGRQHGILSLFRAVENQRPLIRSSCSGYTVAIDASGRILPGSPEAYTEGWVTARVPLPKKRLTLYTHWGDWFPKLCLGVLILTLSLIILFRIISYLRSGSKDSTEKVIFTIVPQIRLASNDNILSPSDKRL